MKHPTVSGARRAGGKMLRSDSFVPTLLRWTLSSQVASWVDMFMGFALFAWVNLVPWLSTALGALAGGVLNCYINYRFTYHVKDGDWRAIIVKYALVWVGSATLNSLGTQWLYILLENWRWLETIGFRPDGYYAVARLTASFLVSVLWNFFLQRYFVYRPTRFDRHAVNMVKAVSPKLKTTKQ